jgi:hypothetical protein
MSEDPRTGDGAPGVDDPLAPSGAEAPGGPPPPVPADRYPSAARAGREPGDLVIALSPRQIFGGFALMAGLILMLRRRGRRRD